MHDTHALMQPVRCRAVIRYLARLGIILAALSLPPLAVAFAGGEQAMGWRYLALAVLLVLPELVFRRSPLPKRLQTNESLVIVALLYLLAPALLTWPLAAAGAAPLEAWFEAVSTGGFAPADASLAEFPDWARRAAVLGVAALGAVPLLLYYRGWRRGWRVLATYPEVRALVLLTLGFGLLLAWSLYQALGLPPRAAVGHGLLTALSAQTGTGFFTLNPASMGSVCQLLLCATMQIGGGMASTAGGIRLLRLLLLFSLLRWLVARASMPPDAVLRPQLAGHRLESGEVTPALLTILLFILLVVLSWSIFVAAGSPPIPALFEVVSAVGTVGLSSGLAGPELPAGLKTVSTSPAGWW